MEGYGMGYVHLIGKVGFVIERGYKVKHGRVSTSMVCYMSPLKAQSDFNRIEIKSNSNEYATFYMQAEDGQITIIKTKGRYYK